MIAQLAYLSSFSILSIDSIDSEAFLRNRGNKNSVIIKKSIKQLGATSTSTSAFL